MRYFRRFCAALTCLCIFSALSCVGPPPGTEQSRISPDAGNELWANLIGGWRWVKSCHFPNGNARCTWAEEVEDRYRYHVFNDDGTFTLIINGDIERKAEYRVVRKENMLSNRMDWILEIDGLGDHTISFRYPDSLIMGLVAFDAGYSCFVREAAIGFELGRDGD
jgi:hypothetical protein